MERFGTARRTVGVLMKTVVATALVATIALSSGMGSVARRSGLSIAVDDGVYGGTTTAWVLASDGGQAANVATELWVWATCYQGGDLVYWENPKVGSGMSAELTLGPTAWWTSGAAECTGQLKTWDFKRSRWVVLATDTFSAAG